MLELKLLDSNKLEDSNLPSNIAKIYSINDNIGYICILASNINKIYIYIKEQYRGNGFGTEALKQVLKEFKDELTFETSNPISKRMLIKAGGIEIGTNDGITRIKLFID